MSISLADSVAGVAVGSVCLVFALGYCTISFLAGGEFNQIEQHKQLSPTSKNKALTEEDRIKLDMDKCNKLSGDAMFNCHDKITQRVLARSKEIEKEVDAVMNKNN